MIRKQLTVLMLIAAVMITVIGCSSDPSPKEALVSALEKMQNAKSYSVKGTIAVDDLVLPETGTAPAAQMTGTMLQLLKGATISYQGIVQKEPARSELTLDLKLGSGPVTMNLQLPVIVTKEKLWIKVPQIPLLALPEAIAGKFIEIDLGTLAKEQGQEMQTLDAQVTQQMVQEMTRTLIEAYEGDKYFSSPKADVKGLPDTVKDDQLVRFTILPANSGEAVAVFTGQVLPKWIDLLLEHDSYRTLLPLTKDDLEKAKQELSGSEAGPLKDKLESWKKNATVTQFSLTGAIHDGYPVYQELAANLEYKDNGQSAKLNVHGQTQFEKINEDVKFEYGLPTDAVPLADVEALLTGTGTGTSTETGNGTGS